MHTVYIWPERGYIYTITDEETRDLIYAEVCGGQRLVDFIQARKKRPLRIVAEHASCVKQLNRLVKGIEVSISEIDYLALREWEDEKKRVHQTDYRGPEESLIFKQKKKTRFNNLSFIMLGIFSALLIAHYFIVTPFLEIHSLSLERRLNDSVASLQYLESQVNVTVLWDAVLMHYPNSVIEHIEINHYGDFSIIFLNPSEGLRLLEKYNLSDVVLEQGQRIQGVNETVYIIYILTGRSLW